MTSFPGVPTSMTLNDLEPEHCTYTACSSAKAGDWLVAVEVRRDVEPTQRAPVFITRRPTTRRYPPRRRPMNVPRCTGAFCSNGGTCTMFTGRATCMSVGLLLYRSFSLFRVFFQFSYRYFLPFQFFYFSLLSLP